MNVRLFILFGSLLPACCFAAQTNSVFPRTIRDPNSTANAQKMMREGQEIFRYDTFGDEAFWGGQLRLHEAVATLTPSNALALGRGLFAHAKGGFFHDGRFATLLDVVNHYNSFFSLGLSDAEKSDLVEYLKSL